MIHNGDCVEVMAAMPENSVDAIVCDPPYGIGFMSKDWDAPGEVGDFPMRRSKAINTVNTGLSRQGGRQQQGLDFQKRQAKDGRAYQERSEAWAREAYRVAKPGSYLLAFGGTRTVHRMTSGIEDAGWIIRDCLVWAYAQGFPKSRALLKPAWEPIVMARKPGPLRELAIDACRIAAEPYSYPNGPRGGGAIYGNGEGIPPIVTPVESNPLGRWPANVILTDPIFDGDVEGVVGGGEANRWFNGKRAQDSDAPLFVGTDAPLHKDAGASTGYDDTGTYSRFFLVPKSARSEREPGWWNPTVSGTPSTEGVRGIDPGVGMASDVTSRPARLNHHPTVKPIDLMRHLVRLVTPPGGTVLDPFLGSGTTAIAAEMEGFAWIGIEREAEYVAIAEARLMGVQKGLGLDVPAPNVKAPTGKGHWPKERGKGSEGWGFTGQSDLEERYDGDAA